VTDARDLAALDAWLSGLGDALAPLPAREREDIVLEARSHVLESVSRPLAPTVAQVLDELGSPRAYAREFLVLRPPVSPPPLGVLQAMSRVAAGPWRRRPVLAVAAVAYGLAGMFALLAISELIDPSATGIYANWTRGERYFFIVASDPRHREHEILGSWLIPVMIVLIALIHLGMRRLLRRVAGAVREGEQP
jgi:hypothetical protein